MMAGCSFLMDALIGFDKGFLCIKGRKDIKTFLKIVLGGFVMKKFRKKISKVMLVVLISAQITSSVGITRVWAEEEAPEEVIVENQEEKEDEDSDKKDNISDEKEVEDIEQGDKENDDKEKEKIDDIDEVEDEVSVEEQAEISILSLEEEIEEAPVVVEEKVKTTEAMFYVLKRGGDRKNLHGVNYTPLGAGKIIDPQKIYEDCEEIEKRLYSIPSLECLKLASDEKIEWYSLKKEVDGYWHVDGEIVKKDGAEAKQPSEEEVLVDTSVVPPALKQENVTTTKALFYVVKRGGSRTNLHGVNYTPLGEGRITDPTKLYEEYEAIEEHLYEIPSTDSLNLEENERIEWYSIKKEVDGYWHVDGEIKEKEAEDILIDMPGVIPPEPEFHYDNLDECDMMNVSNWRKGGFGLLHESYDEEETYLSLTDYKEIEEGTTYIAYLSEKSYRFEVNTYSITGELLKNYTLANGDSFTAAGEEAFVSVSIHSIETEKKYEDYMAYFQEGYAAILTSKDGIQIKYPQEKPKDLYTELELMLAEGDTTVHDVSRYNYTLADFYNKIGLKLKDEHMIEFKSAYRLDYGYTYEGKILKTIWFENMDADYLKRYKRTKKAVDEYLSMVDSKMSSLDKVVLAHEFITQKAEYVSNPPICYTAGGALGNGKAVCQGYTEAMDLLMNLVGVDVDQAISKSMDHSWNSVKIDGKWYLLDATWDDTQKGSDEAKLHRFLIRNTQEFETIKGTSRAHSNWKYQYNKASNVTSTAFTNWFVHDVPGYMYYKNGLWYYKDGNVNSIIASDIYGNGRHVVVDGTGETSKITLIGVTGNQVIYKIGSTQYTKEI